MIEITDKRVDVAYMGGGVEHNARALSALVGRNSLPAAPAPWSTLGLMPNAPTGESFRGRVLIELWTGMTNVAMSTAPGQSSTALLQAARQALGA
jgi:hypothetical protein